jgi:hypothetical protein
VKCLTLRIICISLFNDDSKWVNDVIRLTMSLCLLDLEWVYLWMQY